MLEAAALTGLDLRLVAPQHAGQKLRWLRNAAPWHNKMGEYYADGRCS